MVNQLTTGLLGTLSIIFFSAASRGSDEPLQIGTYFIPEYVINKNEGKYIDLYKEIERRFEWNSKLLMQPAKRIQYNFKSGSLMGYFPVLSERKPTNSCQTEPFDIKTVHAFTLRGNPLIHKISDMEGLRLGAVAGYSYGSSITQNPKLNITYVKNDLLNVKKLKARHIDAIIGDSVTTLAAIRQLQVNNEVQYDSESPLSILEVFFVFQNNPLGIKLCQEASTVITERRQLRN